MAKAPVLTRVDYRCIHCQLDLGDPNRQRSPFHLWLEAVRVHIWAHGVTVIDELVHAHIAPKYS